MNRKISLRIAYIFMQYPYPSQVFGISDVQTLQAQGHAVETYSLRAPHPKHNALCSMYNVPNQHKNSASISTLKAFCSLKSIKIMGMGLLTVLNHTRSPKHILKSILILPQIACVLHQLKQNPPDVVHIFWGHYPSLLGVLLKATLPDVHLSLFCGAYDLERQYPLTPLAAKLADSVWTHAHYNVPHLVKFGFEEEKINVVHRGLPLQTFPDLSHIEKTPNHICVVSAFQKSKNISACIAAFPYMIQENPAVTMTIIGDGDERENLKAQVKQLGLEDKITFTGYLPRQQVLTEVAKADIFLFLSTKASDRLPNVAKEAMLANCTCVVSNTAGIDELIPSNAVGYVIEDLSPTNVAKHVCAAFNQPHIGTAAKTFIMHNFDAQVCMMKYVDVWKT